MSLKKVLINSPNILPEILTALEDNDFSIVDDNPDFILCYGGDGTILYSERQFPQIPKLVLKHSSTCRTYDYTLKDLDVLLNNIRAGRYTLSQDIKLETTINDETLLGLNELQVRAKLPISALRFSLYVDRKRFEHLIGDGVVVATPFGSTGYYQSTGGQRFKKGIGISFNNLHNAKIESFVVSENSVVQVEINRGPAWILADNYERFIELNDDDTCTIAKSESIAQFIIAL